MENISKDHFQNLDFGTGAPSPVKMETVEVELSAGQLMDDYCVAFINEANRKMPLTAALDGALTLKELKDYCNYLLTERIKCVELRCPEWRKLKVLWIPSFIQYVLSCVGEVIVRDYGIKFIPTVTEESSLSYDEAVLISDKIGAFEEKLQMVRDAMPRGVEGDSEVMSCAIIESYVRSWKKVTHPSFTYVSAFLDAHLKNEIALKALYRIL
jgi:hypothetical protein